MTDEDKTKEQLVNELAELRQRVVELEASETGRQQAEEGQRFALAEALQTTHALRESEERLQTILDSIQAGIVTIDAETHMIVDANPAAIEMFGAPREQVIGSVCHNYICPAEKGRCPITDLGQGVDGAERELLRANGETIPILKTVVPIMLDGRQHLLESFIDITERVRAEDLIRAQRDLGLALVAVVGLEKTLRLCVETAIRIAEMDCGGVYLVDKASGDVDLAFSKGLHPDLVKSFSHLDADSAGARLIIADKPVYTRLQELGVPIEEPLRREGLRAVAIVPVHHEGRMIACLNVASRTLDEIPVPARNVLETMAAQIGSAIARVQAEEALRKSEERYKLLLESISDGVFALNRAWRYTLVNDIAARFVQTPQENLLGNKITDLFPGIEKTLFFTTYERVMETRKPDAVVNEFTFEDGRKGWYEVRVYPVPEGILCIAADITERVRAEEQIKTALREKEELLREIHHRVKNNLQVISGLFDLSGECTDNQETIDLLEDARARIHTMALIHSQLYQSDRFDQIDLVRHIEELADFLAQMYAPQRRHITLLVEPSDVTLPVTRAIPCALALNEVISNAFKHAFREGQRGTIQISTRRLADDLISITVQDDGVGFPADVDVYNIGSLGLKLVRGLVQGQLGGRLWVERHKGTRVVMEFAGGDVQ